ncbi:MAG: hypothetical protein Q8N99_07055 [Nanoarchaeota archaeon]|nr:hypothetical protein [Nanoarchaeota archaeon]
MKEKKKKKEDNTRYCDPDNYCKSEYNGICSRFPEILSYGKVFQITDSRDLNKGEYLETHPKPPASTELEKIRCPFSNPLEKKVKELDSQTALLEAEPRPDPDRLMSRIIRAGLRTPGGKALLLVYVVGIAAFGANKIIQRYTTITPQIDQYCQDRYQDIQDTIESIGPYIEPFKEFVETNLNS